jgi:hypothetical protein
METVRIRDPEWKKVGSGIRDKHPASATLILDKLFKTFFPEAYFFSSTCNIRTYGTGINKTEICK